MGNGFVPGHSSSGSLAPAVEEAAELAIGSKLMNQIDSIHPGEHLACISHHPTVEAHDTTAMTSLRLLAVLNVLFKYACARQAARALS